MKHFEVKHFDGTVIVHFDGITGDSSMCGSDLVDDSLGWHPGKETSKKVTCPHCIRMYEFFKSVSKTEVGKPVSLPS